MEEYDEYSDEGIVPIYGSEGENEEEPIEGVEQYYYDVGEVVSLGTDGGFVKMDNEFLVHGEGILIKDNTLIIQGYWEHGNTNGQLIVCDFQNHSIVGVYNVEMNVITAKKDLSQIEEDQDIVFNGNTWKGSVLNNKPYGWGDLFSSSNELLYSGFMIDSKKVCYGTIYDYEGSCKYSGTIYNSKPFGAGVIYAENGKCIYDGGIVDGTHRYSGILSITKMNQEDYCFHSLLEEITLDSNCYSEWTYFSISGYTFLRKLTIGDECFLRKRTNLNYHDDTSRAFFTNCPSLESIVIGRDSFAEFGVCEFRGLPALQSLMIGTNENHVGCFVKATEFVLESSLYILNS